MRSTNRAPHASRMPRDNVIHITPIRHLSPSSISLSTEPPSYSPRQSHRKRARRRWSVRMRKQPSRLVALQWPTSFADVHVRQNIYPRTICHHLRHKHNPSPNHASFHLFLLLFQFIPIGTLDSSHFRKFPMTATKGRTPYPSLQNKFLQCKRISYQHLKQISKPSQPPYAFHLPGIEPHRWPNTWAPHEVVSTTLVLP